MNNENKTKLILLIASTLNEDQCENVLNLLTERISLANSKVFNKAEWDESKHHRDYSGRFSPIGSGRADMTKSEQKRWDEIGKSVPRDRRTAKIKSEIARIEKQQQAFQKGDTYWNYLESKIAKRKRELYELERDIKMEKRISHEGKVSERINAKKIKRFYDVEEEIDYYEEKYADRNPGSTTQNEVVFPKTKKGERDKAKYEGLLIERNELNEDIDWEQAEENE